MNYVRTLGKRAREKGEGKKREELETILTRRAGGRAKPSYFYLLLKVIREIIGIDLNKQRGERGVTVLSNTEKEEGKRPVNKGTKRRAKWKGAQSRISLGKLRLTERDTKGEEVIGKKNRWGGGE